MHTVTTARVKAPVRAAALLLAFLVALGSLWTPVASAQAAPSPQLTPVSQAGSLAAHVDLEFDDAPLAQVFQSLADVAGLNVLLDPDVDGRVSFTLRSIPADDAIDLVARLTGYRYQIIGNTLVVASAERLRSDFRNMGHALMPVHYVELQTAADLVTRLYPDVHVIPDHATNTLIVRGDEEELAGVQEFLAVYDRNLVQPLQFRNAPVDSVLWALADRAGWNLVIEGRLDGELTAHLEGMDYREALGLVSDAAALHYRLNDNVLYVRQLEAPPEAVPVRRLAIFRLDHVNPERTREVLAGLYPDMHFDLDEQSRSLIVEGEDFEVAAVERFVREVDVPRRQVIVEARLEEINVDALHRLGIDWGEDRAAVVPQATNPLVLALDPSILRGRLEALHDEGLSKILASPKLATIEGEPATILIGERIPIIMQIIEEDGRISETLEFIEAGIMLDITATVGDDDSVTMQINTEVSSITGMTHQNVPQIRTREMNTLVRVYDGQSLVIGGLIQEDEREAMRGLPFLSDLPLIGSLFGRTMTETVQTEMVVFLIPHIVHDEPAAGGAGTAAGDAGSASTSAGPSEDDASAAATSAVPASVGSVAGATAGNSAGARQNPAHQPVGSVVPLDDGPAVKASAVADDVSIAWVDVISHIDGAYDVGVERRRDNTGLQTGLYFSPSLAYGVGVSMRRYGDEVAGIKPWAGAGVEYIRPLNGIDAGYILSAGVGIGTREAAPLRIEVYGQYSLLHGGLTTPGLDLPARWDGFRTGLRFGWEY